MRHSSETKAQAHPTKTDGTSDGNRRILVIDDHKAILEDYHKILTGGQEGAEQLNVQEAVLFGTGPGGCPVSAFVVNSALQGLEGIDLVKHSVKEGKPYALAFVDIRMPPGLDGVETVERIWEIDAHIQVVFCTAYSDYAWDEIFKRLKYQDRFLVLKKPFDNIEVRQLACALTDKWNLAAQTEIRLNEMRDLVEERNVELDKKNALLQSDVSGTALAEERETGLGQILEKSRNEIYIFDAESLHFIEVNRGARDNLGYSIEDLRVMTPLDLKPEFSAEAFADIIAPLTRKELEKIQFETHHRRKDGSLYPVEVHLHPARFRNKSVFVAFILDLSARKQAEEKRLELEAQLRQAQKMEAVGQLAGGIAHDFNNMLQVINGYVDMVLRQVGETDRIYRKLEHVRKAGERAASLTSQLLAYSRRQVIEPRDLDVNRLLGRVLQMIQRLIGEFVEIVFVPRKNMPTIAADPAQLEQVIINLALNARDAMPGGGTLAITTSDLQVDQAFRVRRFWARSARYVLIEVRDTGKGMSPEVREQAFDPFFTTKEVGKGSGLGLSMAHGIILQHGGEIEIESELGKGTTIKLYLPAGGEAGSAYQSALWRGVELDAGGQGGETILLAEDEDLVRAFMTQALEDEGYRVLTTRNGEEAVQRFRSSGSTIDLVVLDLMMPKLDGSKARKEILAINANIPVLFTSGYSPEAIAENFVLEKDIALLSKPFTGVEFQQRVRRMLDDRRRTSPGAGHPSSSA